MPLQPTGHATEEGLDLLSDAVRSARSRFETSIEPLRPALWRFCYQLTGSAWDAEDLVQETMQRAFARLGDLWQPINPRAYLFRIASNAWIDRNRADARADLVELYEDVAGEADDAEPELRVAAHEALARLVARLTPLQRVVFLLCETLDFRAGEAAAILGTSTGSIKAALHRARRALSEPEPAAGGSPRAEISAAVDDTLVQRFIAAFDARDPDAIASLLHPDAATTIVGSALELGRAASRQGSLAEWALEPVHQRAAAGRLEGRDVVFVLADVGGAPVLYSILELESSPDEIHSLRNYYYCPELLDYAAAGLAMEAITHGYRYEGS